MSKIGCVQHDCEQCQKRKPLTDEQISDVWCRVSNTDFVTADTHEFARAIEAVHGIMSDTDGKVDA